MSHSDDMTRPWSDVAAPLAPTGAQRSRRDGVSPAEDSIGGRQACGVLLRWGPSAPAQRVVHARPLPLRPPEVWCVDHERAIARTADVFLVHTGLASGLVARGLVARAPFLAARQDRIGTVGQHIGVDWAEVHSLATRIPLEVLALAVPEGDWTSEDATVVLLPSDLVERLERVWTEWHHRPQRGHRVAEWVRESGPEAPSAPLARVVAVSRHHRRLASAGHAAHLEVRHAV